MTNPGTIPATRYPEVWGTNSAVILSQEARSTIQRMAWHVGALSTAYGAGHQWTTEAAASFARIMASMVGWGDVTVSRDGDLSLVCYERRPNGGTGLQFGLIFHGRQRSCQVEGCGAIMGANDTIWSYSAEHFPITCEPTEHQWLYPVGAPMPGTWSFHS